jgi:superfamily II DNA or RNA helicase
VGSIELARRLEERYISYLRTLFYFKDRDLRRSFEEALASGRISRGPYLEAMPLFRQGCIPRTLLADIPLRGDEAFVRSIDGDRPLYQHQEAAIREVLGGHNVVVATGTGSGKTEAFLLPILLHLYREFLSGVLGPGVRALVLYPMNALANDQRARLGEIARRLMNEGTSFRFTFGQYIGETPEDEVDGARYAQDAARRRLPGELVFRSEIRETPPHILLTNYSMLEYLLLRPTDSPLFDDGRGREWSFLVLDEAHQYRGARGTEMAMLLRRLKRRVREGGCSGAFRCIATSATLAGGPADVEEVARFASDLFGEPVSPAHVILGEVERPPTVSGGRLGPTEYRGLAEALHRGHGGDQLAHLERRLGVVASPDQRVAAAVGRLLMADERTALLLQRVRERPRDVGEFADEVFGDVAADDRLPELQELIDLLIQVEDPVAGAPLLTARYHLFLRSLEGAYVAYWPEKRVFLDRRWGSDGTTAFETALCRECGQAYFVGRVSGGRFVEAIRDPTDPSFGVTFLRPLEADGDGEDGAQNNEVLRLCLECAALNRNRLPCGHQNWIRVERGQAPVDEDRADQLVRCGACGYSAAGRDPVRELIHGADGPNAVVATTLCQSLPASRRKVLAFADGRQEAAFFAWYLEESYGEILARHLLWRTAERVVSRPSEGLSLRELAVELRQLLREKDVLPPSAGEIELRREAWLRIYREFLTDEQRISLEGVGLVRWGIRWPTWFEIPDILGRPPWTMGEDEARTLVLLLLQTFRSDHAVELHTDGGLGLGWSDLGLTGTQTQMRVGTGGHKAVRRWDGPTGRRAGYLAKLLVGRDLGPPEALEWAIQTLRAIWDTLRRTDEKGPSAVDRLLLSVGDAVRLNPDWWRLQLLRDADTMFSCDTCGRLHSMAVGRVCPRHRCPGKLTEIGRKALETNHYRSLYTGDLPGKLRVEEHTAQLDHEKAREFQREFREGKIQVLSCSTTFELGVDLGDLDAVFLRNVPPEAFNYAQRVGRAGRRARYPGFAVTYCRRAPHDLYHFAEPRRMLEGQVRPPALSLGNEKIVARHVAAVALSSYFRRHPERFRTVGALIRDFERPAGTTDVAMFLRGERAGLELALGAVLPDRAAGAVGLADGTWIERIAGDESRLARAEVEVASDYRSVTRLEADAAQQGDYRTAAWARARAKTIAEEDVLSFLSRKVVIPKYGFPVDVVELDTHRTRQGRAAREVALQRDLSIAIAEFAPSSSLIANKRTWTSYGLKRVAEREWPRYYYKRCRKDNVFCRWTLGEPEPTILCGHQVPRAEYVVPEFGFVTNREEPRPPTSRPTRTFTTRPYFVGPRGPEPGVVKWGPLRLHRAAPGLMVVLCEGRRDEGFYVCGDCGTGFRRLRAPHETPLGLPCRGSLRQVSLGHEFVTDVVQMRFDGRPGIGEAVWFGHSLAYALLEGAASILEVPTADLNATVAYAGDPMSIPPIILYDNVPGGAGLVVRIEDKATLRACLDAAYERVAGGCGCDEGSSCYGCLRSYRNQFAHQHLRRGGVQRFLDELRRRG